MTANVKITPMLQQYLEIKEQHKDTILFYRMGDFYEMFFDDAEIASKILGITLTSRNKKSDTVKVPMCGIPFHAVQGYLAKLVKAGKRVAICEQVENPAEAKGIVKREVVRIVSPGVVTDDGLLDDKTSNYVCALNRKEHKGQILYGISFLEASTGEFLIGEFTEDNNAHSTVLDQLTRLTPSEILINQEKEQEISKLLDDARVLLPGLCVTHRPASLYSQSDLHELLLDHFGVSTLDGFGCSNFTQGIIAAGVLYNYLQETQKTSLDHIARLTPINLETVLQIDDSSRRNLELTQTIVGGKREGSLLQVMDETCTPMGARMLKNNLLFPLQNPDHINRRLAAVSYFYQNSGQRRQLRDLLRTVYDLERLTSRMILGSGNARDMLAMKLSLEQLPPIRQILTAIAVENIKDIEAELDPLTDLFSLIETAINPEAPVTIRDGNLIKEGYNDELDELIAIQRDGKKTIAALELSERQQSGIAKLKIGFNKVFGYYFEVSKIHADAIPEHYIRKQTLVNAERFITPELKKFEEKSLEPRTEDSNLSTKSLPVYENSSLYIANVSCIPHASWPDSTFFVTLQP